MDNKEKTMSLSEDPKFIEHVGKTVAEIRKGLVTQRHRTPSSGWTNWVCWIRRHSRLNTRGCCVVCPPFPPFSGRPSVMLETSPPCVLPVSWQMRRRNRRSNETC